MPLESDTPARESVDVEREKAKLADEYASVLNEMRSEGMLESTAELSIVGVAPQDARDWLDRYEAIAAPPRDSSPAASGERVVLHFSDDQVAELKRLLAEPQPSNVRVEEIPGGLAIKSTRSPVQWSKEPRCEVCDWPLAPTTETGCRPGDCRYRPTQGSDEWYRIKARRDELAACDSSAAESGRVTEPWHVDVRVLAILAAAVRGENDSPLACEIKRLHGRIDELKVTVKAAWDNDAKGHQWNEERISKLERLFNDRAAPPTPAAPEAKPHGDPCDDDDCQRCHHVGAPKPSAPISTDEGEMKACPTWNELWDAKEAAAKAWAVAQFGGADTSLADAVNEAIRKLWNRRAPAPEAERETQPSPVVEEGLRIARQFAGTLSNPRGLSKLSEALLEVYNAKVPADPTHRLRDLLRTVEEQPFAFDMVCEANYIAYFGAVKFKACPWADAPDTLKGPWIAATKAALLSLARGEESEGGK